MMEFGDGLLGGARALAKPLARFWLMVLRLFVRDTNLIFTSTV